MKRRSVVLFYASISVALAAFSQAQPAADHAAIKIAVLNFNAAVLQTAEAQHDLGALQTKLAPRQTQLQALNDDVEASRRALNDPGSKLNDAERAQRTQALEVKEKQLQRESEDFRSDSQNESQQVFQRIAQKVYAFLQTYSQQHGYSAVIERGSDQVPIVWYAAAELDITNPLIKAYNAEVEGPARPTGQHGSGSPPSLPETPAKPQP